MGKHPIFFNFKFFNLIIQSLHFAFIQPKYSMSTEKEAGLFLKNYFKLTRNPVFAPFPRKDDQWQISSYMLK